MHDERTGLIPTGRQDIFDLPSTTKRGLCTLQKQGSQLGNRPPGIPTTIYAVPGMALGTRVEKENSGPRCEWGVALRVSGRMPVRDLAPNGLRPNVLKLKTFPPTLTKRPHLQGAPRSLPRLGSSCLSPFTQLTAPGSISPLSLYLPLWSQLWPYQCSINVCWTKQQTNLDPSFLRDLCALVFILSSEYTPRVHVCWQQTPLQPCWEVGIHATLEAARLLLPECAPHRRPSSALSLALLPFTLGWCSPRTAARCRLCGLGLPASRTVTVNLLFINHPVSA